MNESMAVQDMWTTVTLFGLTILFFFLLPAQALDWYRHRLFCLRAELFLLAADKDVAYDDPSYQMLRGLTNGLLRFGHKYTITRMLLFSLIVKKEDLTNVPDFSAIWEASLEDKSEEVKQRLIKINEQIEEATMLYMLFGTPLFLITIIPPLIFIATYSLAKNSFDWLVGRSRRLLRRQLSNVDTEIGLCGAIA